MNNPAHSTEQSPSIAPETGTKSISSQDQSKITIGIIAGVVLVAAVVVGSGYFLLRPETDTAKWRDAFIVALSMELFILGIVAVILIFQLARLVNLIQNEVRPVLEAANETMNTVRGTADFLSENLVSPVVKVNSFMAAARRLLALVNIKF
jgi:hypothetical protein